MNEFAGHELDLPLMANVDEVRVVHYILDLKCSFVSRTMIGHVILLLKYPDQLLEKFSGEQTVGEASFVPTGHSSGPLTEQESSETSTKVRVLSHSTKRAVRIVLDACDLHVSGVHELKMTKTYSLSADTDSNYLKHIRDDAANASKTPLSYTSDKWSIEINKAVDKVEDVPLAVQIDYATDVNGGSLTWTTDQCGRLCMFTQGAWINNRSLFPCQDLSTAMATWQATITAPEDAIVLMTGDENGETAHSANGSVSVWFYTTTPLPSSMLAIAVGFWSCYEAINEKDAEAASGTVSDPGRRCRHEPYPCRSQHFTRSLIPTRIFAVESLLRSAVDVFGGGYLRRCLVAAFEKLGPHPFPRLDVLVVPKCFASLGLASPNLLFLSQSVLADIGGMCIRVAHEISHNWFGLLLGAKDWTEEWISEGFSTYMEDSIHGAAMGWDEKERKDYAELRALLRYRTLSAELENTSEELQTLRPGGDSYDRKREEQRTVDFVKNGMNPDKCFTQVHYLKGYFLLRHLSELVGVEKFDSFLRDYVWHFHGLLVLSREFFDMFFHAFPFVAKNGLSSEEIYSEWLDCPGLPKCLRQSEPSSDNELYKQVCQEFEMWKSLNGRICEKRKGTKRKKCADVSGFNVELRSSDQIVLLLEFMLELDVVAVETLQCLHRHFTIGRQNADVRHRWCELVIKHGYHAANHDVENFLEEDQAMGVYLYGELILSKLKKHNELARKYFEQHSPTMDVNCRKTVEEMLGVT